MADDVDVLLAHVDRCGLVPVDEARGWDHMGAVVTDAALQAGVRYRSVVLPRVRRLIAAWPTANTTSAFAAALESGDIGEVLPWKGKKVATIHGLTRVLAKEDIETVPELRAALTSRDRAPELRRELRTVKGVGPKTVDYLAILVGSTEHAAVDTHVRQFAADAGLAPRPYEQLTALVRDAAKRRGWTPGGLDAAIWAHQSP